MTKSFDPNAGQQALLLLGTFTKSEGMYRYFEACADDLSRNGVDVRASVSGLQSSLLRPIRACLRFGYSTYPIMVIVFFPWLVFSIASYCHKLEKNGIKNLRLIDDFVFSSIHLLLLRLFFRGNITVTVHDPKPHSGHIRNWAVSVVYHVNRLALVLLTMCSESVRIHIHAVRLWLEASYFGSVPAIISPHPIPNPSANVEYNPDYARTFIFIGRLEPYKGLQIFLDAVALLRDEDPQLFSSATYAVLGRGDTDSYDWRKLHTHLNFYCDNSFLSRQEFEEYISSAGFVVLPYVDATSSGVAALAVAYERPVIVTNVGDLVSFTEHNESSCVVENVCARDLKHAMVALLPRRAESRCHA